MKTFTFYSYKGGTGRSLLLANTARQLALLGKRVVCRGFRFRGSRAPLQTELQADFLLIDSRTGVTELAGLTTTVLADKVVCLMLVNRESQTGARAVLRSLRHAVRLAGQSPIEIIPVLSRVPERDETLIRDTLAFLNAPGPTPEDTLSLEELFVLRTDPELDRGDKLLHLGSGEILSPLGQDYLALMAELVDANPAKVNSDLERLRSMPRLPALSLSPPQHWQEFEDPTNLLGVQIVIATTAPRDARTQEAVPRPHWCRARSRFEVGRAGRLVAQLGDLLFRETHAGETGREP